MKDNKLILKTWKGNGNGTIVVALPCQITKKYNLNVPSHVIVQATTNGILIRKLDL